MVGTPILGMFRSLTNSTELIIQILLSTYYTVKMYSLDLFCVFLQDSTIINYCVFKLEVF